MIRVIADEVNLRVTPSTEAEVIATVDTDTQLPLIETVTDEDELKELINAGKAKLLYRIDATADSLHVGHFMTLCLMKRLQMAGNKLQHLLVEEQL